MTKEYFGHAKLSIDKRIRKAFCWSQQRKKEINDLTIIALTGIEHCLIYQPLILSIHFHSLLSYATFALDFPKSRPANKAKRTRQVSRL
jgi:hypothetical protein